MPEIEIIYPRNSFFGAVRMEEAFPRNSRTPLMKISFFVSLSGFAVFALLEFFSFLPPDALRFFPAHDMDYFAQKAFGAFLFSFGVFWLLWVSDFYFLAESKPAPFLRRKTGGFEDKIYSLDFGGARRVREISLLRLQEPDLSGIYRIFGKSLSSRLLPMRLGLDYSVFYSFVEKKKNSRTPIAIRREDLLKMLADEADASGSDTIGAKEFILLLYKYDEDFKKFLFDFGIREKELRGAAGWVASFLASSRAHSRWWEREFLGRVPGIGKDLGYGYTPALDSYSRDISLRESFGVRIFAHKKTIEMIEDILARSGEANVLLVGAEGVGKQTILSSLARMISEGKAVPELEHKRMVMFDASSLSANAKTKSDIEGVLIKIMNQASHAGNIILVFDNFSDFLSSIAKAGADAMALLEPYFAGARIQVIALADPESFHRELEQNGKIAKLFQKVEVPEPSEEEAVKILQNAAEVLEKRSNYITTFQAIEAAYDLAERFVPEGAMPEKAIDLLDQALSGSEGGGFLMPQDIEKIIQARTNIPMQEVNEDESKKLLELENLLHKRIVGQEAAVKGVANAMRRLRAGLHEGKRPIGSFLFLGPTGVGKTETAKALAEAYFGSEKNMLRFDMSEYRGEDGMKKLIGSFDAKEPGLLATALRAKPFAVLLFDEFEKASREVVNIFLQILDEGFFTDAFGKKVSARDALLIATSNAGSSVIWDMLKSGKDPSLVKDDVIDAIRKDGLFSPELLNRFDEIIIFHPLGAEHLKSIANILLEDLASRLKEKDINFKVTEELAEEVAKMGFEPLLGARPMRRVITDKVEQAVAKKILEKKLSRGGTFELSADDLKNIE